MTQNTPKNQEFSEDDLFRFTMEKQWDKVVEIYEKHSESHTTKLTKSEETALHICVSSYHSKYFHHSKHIKKMIDCIEKSSSVSDVLSMQNVKGDTPLHLAATVGWEAICEYIASKDWNLIGLRNASGETPLFIAADHGEMQAFLCLHENYNKEGEADVSPCRTYDGTTILHVAISREYFRLAYQIISYYPELINSVNEEGESKLHVLARKPNVFKSSYQIGFYDSLIYHCVFVEKLKNEKYNPRATRNGYSPSSEIKFPENYRTCVNIFFLFWTPIYKSFSAGFPWNKKQDGGQTNAENQHQRQNKTQKEKSISDDDVYPPNHATCILLFQFAMKVILSVLGVGYWRTKKILEKKKQHIYAFQIMNKMIESESRYKYDNAGQRPPDKLVAEERIEIPDKARKADEHDAAQSTETNIEKTSSTKAQRENETMKDENKSGENTDYISIKDTPILVAAKTGIPEMVKKIISTWPIAIRDQGSDGKNILLLAAENRQSSVFYCLIEINPPEYMFYQLDKEGNSILHLAAKLGEDMHPWRTPCVPLQLSWEVKWFEYVKYSSVPSPTSPTYVPHNKQGKTPRKIFMETHAKIVKEAKEWLTKTSESCPVVAALIVSVTFATIANVPGGLNDQTGHPILGNYTAFDIFSVASLFALCLSVTALIFFLLAIIASQYEMSEFATNMPRKLLMGLTSLSASIATMLIAFCAGHTFILTERLRAAAILIYAVATLPVMFFAIAQLPLYVDFVCAAYVRQPLLSYRAMYS